MEKTMEDLKAAFAGESQACQRYLAFAKKADTDGFPQVAKLFRAAAHAESIHASNHLKAMGGIKSTGENLEEAIDGENYEVITMYPDFIKDAEAEQNKKALTTFQWAWDVEKVHEDLYRKALAAGGQDLPDVEYFVCPVCGYVEEKGVPEKCPVCGTPGSRFEKIA